MDPKFKIFLTLFLTLAFTWIIKENLPDQRSNSQIERDFWIKKTHSKKKYDIVVGGNSRIYRGVSINAMKSEIDVDLKGINLGYSALGFTTEYLDFLKNRINPSSNHKFIILGIDPGVLTPIAAENKSFNAYREVSESEIFRTLYINPYFTLPAYKPTEIYEIIIDPDTLKDGFIEVRDHYYGRYEDDGWVASYKIPHNPDEALPIYKKFAEDYNVQLSSAIWETLLLKIKEFQKEGIQVIAFRPPSTSDMEKWENKRYDFHIDTIASRIREQGGYWLSIDTQIYNSYDGAHLHYKSAEQLSKIVGCKINELVQSN